jgi:hypothetical protein
MAARDRARRAVLALRVLAVAAAVPLITRLPLPRQVSILQPRRRRTPNPARAAWLAENVDRIIAAGRPVVRPGCLTRGLTHYYFLSRAGSDVRLVFGIGEMAGRPEGHCWLERAGEPYLEREDPRPHFVETWSVPAHGASRVHA